MIKHGVALVRVSDDPCGCGQLEEFYVVVDKGTIINARFASYAEAVKYAAKLLAEERANTERAYVA